MRTNPSPNPRREGGVWRGASAGTRGWHDASAIIAGFPGLCATGYTWRPWPLFPVLTAPPPPWRNGSPPRQTHPDALVFFRMGDFYELFFADAEAAAAALDIALTHRGEHAGAPIPMCGVPVHAAEAYLARLIRRGFRVAVAEQMEDPKTPHRQGADPPRGGAPDHARHAHRGRAAGSRPAQPAAGPGAATRRRHRRGLARCLHRPVRDRRACRRPNCRHCSAGSIRRRSSRPPPWRWASGAAARAPAADPPPPLIARRRLAEAFGAASLDAFGSFTDAEAVAAALALDYVRATQAGRAAAARAARSPQGRPARWRWTRRRAPAWKSCAPATAARSTRCSPRCSAR